MVQISKFVYELSEVLAEMLVPFLYAKLSFVNNKEISLKARKYDTLRLSKVTITENSIAQQTNYLMKRFLIVLQ